MCVPFFPKTSIAHEVILQAQSGHWYTRWDGYNNTSVEAKTRFSVPQNKTSVRQPIFFHIYKNHDSMLPNIHLLNTSSKFIGTIPQFSSHITVLLQACMKNSVTFFHVGSFQKIT